ncbi:alpha/beta fold hydrolase [Amycolatopsis pigmentata]|uniref:Alpha/beta fold hydrolase n=1 Tax=Amycolatopsis pigmentata TaxID=450801 RepID=A0ABW5FVM0_9PSEU
MAAAPRGVGYSAGVTCKDDSTQPDPFLPKKEKARFEAERDGRNHQRCVTEDPEFVRNLTTANIARDMDRIRIALGEDKIGYYGVSWGTALGAQYRTLFDAHVDKMLLDSVMAPTLITSARRDWPASARDLAGLRDGSTLKALPGKEKSTFGWDAGQPGFSPFQQTSVLCDDSGSTRDFDEIWNARLRLIEQLPISGQYGTEALPCVGWPIPAQPWQFASGTSPLQLVGHLYEQVTPIGWAREMRQRIGGALLTVEDDVHGSLSTLPCGAKAVAFFDTGKVSNDSCPGAPVSPA